MGHDNVCWLQRRSPCCFELRDDGLCVRILSPDIGNRHLFPAGNFGGHRQDLFALLAKVTQGFLENAIFISDAAYGHTGANTLGFDPFVLRNRGPRILIDHGVVFGCAKSVFFGGTIV